MASETGIQWSDATWTPIRARVKPDAGEIAAKKQYTSLVRIATEMAGRVGPHCEHCSPGCDNCYSETNNERCLPYNGTGLPFDRRARDLVDVFIDEKILLQPLKWRQPKKIFVCSQTDLFGEWVPDEVIDRVFAVMALCPQHTFQVLTKRAQRMLNYFGLTFGQQAQRDVFIEGATQALYANLHPAETDFEDWLAVHTPLPNVWLGVSDEGDRHERLELLRHTPAAVRFVSFEPLIVDPSEVNLSGIDWAIIGGESGVGARPMDEAWVRSLVQQCQAAGVKVFVKQMGSVPMEAEELWRGRTSMRIISVKNRNRVPAGYVPILYQDHGNIEQFPQDLRIREFPGVSDGE